MSASPPPPSPPKRRISEPRTPLRGSFFADSPQTTVVDVAAKPAVCRSPNACERSTASRLLAGRLAIPPIELPDTGPVSEPGRVHGLGRFEDSSVYSALAAALPPGIRADLRTGFEWYACRGAFFHHDAHFSDVLFGAWCVAGPRREIVFSRLAMRVLAAPGDWVVFDPFEPHAVLDSGTCGYTRERYAAAPVSLFIGFELALNEAVRRAFGVGPPPVGAAVLATRTAVNAETGALG